MFEDRLKDLSFAKFTKLYQGVVEKILEDPMKNFVESKNFMNFKPSPAQRVILKIVFQQRLDAVSKTQIPVESYDADGMFKLVSRQMSEVELYEYLTGRKYKPALALSQVVNKIDLICGRRSGKTTMAAIIGLYCAITTNWKPFLHKTPFATVLVMSHSTEFSIEVLDIIKYFVNESPILSKLINKSRKQTNKTLNLKMPFVLPDGTVDISQVQIKVSAASSKTTRGIAACAVICDEIAFWNLDESLKETDTKILKALRPALTQFGKRAFMFKLSSPGIRQGVLYTEYEEYQAGTLPKSYAVFKAPTWMMNLKIPEEELAEEFELDQEGFMVEYGGEFSDSISSFIMSSAIDIAITKGMDLRPPDDDPDLKFYSAIDAGFKGDTFTFTVVAMSENRVKQFLSKGWRGTKKTPVKSHEVAKWIANATKMFPIDYIGADQFAFEPLREIFDFCNLTLKEYVFSTTFKKKIYYNLKKLIHSDQIDLLDNPIQEKELRQLVVEQAPSGAIKIGHPKGGSDDFSDALAVACYIATVENGGGVFDLEVGGGGIGYKIKVSREGIAFGAPSPTMLMNSGHFAEGIQDNSSEYGVDPEDGRLKRVENFLSDGDEDDDSFEVSF